MARKVSPLDAFVSVGGGAAAAPALEPKTVRAKSGGGVRKTAPRKESAPGSPNGAAGVAASITQEDIARLAHALWTARGCQDGSQEEDWFRAEAEIKAQMAASNSNGE